MPAPLRVTHADMISATRAIIERDGIDAVTMSAVAVSLGIRPPSMYKKVADRRALLELVGNDVAEDVLSALRSADRLDATPRAALIAYARAYRAVAATSPQAMTLLFTHPAGTSGPIRELLDKLLTAVSAATPSDPLPIARTLTSWLFGFCTLEQAGAFRSGGNVDEAFEWGLANVVP